MVKEESFNINLTFFNDAGDEDTFHRRCNMFMKEIAHLCQSYNLYYGGSSSFSCVDEKK